MITVLTHNFPHAEKPFAGIFIKNMLELVGGEYEVIGYRGFGYNPLKLTLYLIRTFYTTMRHRTPLLAFWIYPAGVLAWLSGRRYSLVCVGVDIFSIVKRPLFCRLALPVLAKAEELIFIGAYPRQVFESAYGDRFQNKSRLIHLPVEPSFIDCAHARLATTDHS